MKRILETIDPFRLVQQKIDFEDNQPTESVMSLGNGYMGARGNYEEAYSGKTLKGTYIAGVWMPDKTRVGWWKNGYPRYYGKVINAPDFLSFDLFVNEQRIDLATANITSFERIVNMETGIMQRVMEIEVGTGSLIVNSTRFFSIARKEIACMKYSVTAVGDVGEVKIVTGIDGNVTNTDANYGDRFWIVNAQMLNDTLWLQSKTIENEFGIEQFTVGFSSKIFCDTAKKTPLVSQNSVKEVYEKNLHDKETIKLEKIVSVVTTRDYLQHQLQEKADFILNQACNDGICVLEQEQENAWKARWCKGDVVIEGDDAAQQGIRFNLFHLWSTYDGSDERLNVGPKGFTGEKYGGAAYYDTEGYCFPMYLATADPKVARNLLMFRYNTLEKAKENAAKIGMSGALYPMVTFNGEECHNEWEITFEELHRNAAIVYAIFCYTRYTGDESYIQEYGIHVMVEIARFWMSRSNYNAKKDCYMLIGVTAPNEYENNINNNFLTNYMAKWCIEFALSYVEKFNYAMPEEEKSSLRTVAEKMYLVYDEQTKLFLQQDGFMDKELLTVSSIPPEELPLCKHWSWDRILRSCFIKQADVILAMYYFPTRFTKEQKQSNFRFYEPMTVHESSLSPSMYSTVASACGFQEDAYRLYQRAARLDLDNFNADTDDGLHITSMAGSWISVAHGFAGMYYQEGVLRFQPSCPKQWKRIALRILYRGRLLAISFDTKSFSCEILEGEPLVIAVNEQEIEVRNTCMVSLKK